MGAEESFIIKWRKLTEEKLGWGDPAGWTDYDFERLSELVFEQTKTRLSVSTLKRIWGKVRYESTPNMATLNIMASFSGFADWRAFKQQDRSQSPPEVRLICPDRKFRGRKVLLPGIFILLLLLSGAFLVLERRSAWGPAPARVLFESRKMTDDLPNSVVFNYDASGFKSDSVYLQQSWDLTRTEKIPARGKEYTSVYYYPGYFHAKLVVDKKVRAANDVYIKTKGWVGIVEKSPVPTYLEPAAMRTGDALGITTQTLVQKTGSTVFNNQWVQFYNVREFQGVDGNNFKLEATLRNTSLPAQSACRKLIVYVIGTNNTIIIPLADKGCISTINLFTGDEWLYGKVNDLSAFGCDFSHDQQLACSTDHHQLMISLNGRRIFTRQVKFTIGKVAGLCVAFEGTGEISQIKLGNRKHTVYEENFQRNTKYIAAAR